MNLQLKTLLGQLDVNKKEHALIRNKIAQLQDNLDIYKTIVMPALDNRSGNNVDEILEAIGEIENDIASFYEILQDIDYDRKRLERIIIAKKAADISKNYVLGGRISPKFKQIMLADVTKDELNRRSPLFIQGKRIRDLYNSLVYSPPPTGSPSLRPIVPIASKTLATATSPKKKYNKSGINKIITKSTRKR